VREWVRKSKNTILLENLKQALSLIGGSYADYYREITIKYWFLRPENNTIDNLKVLLPLIKQEHNKKTLVNKWIRNGEPEEVYRRFINVIKNDLLGSRYNYNYDDVVNNFVSCNIALDNIPHLCQSLYVDDEISQSDLLVSFIDRGRLSNIKIIKIFTGNLKNDNCVIGVIRALHSKGNLSEIDLLQIVEGRIDGKYQSIAQLLRNKTLEEALTDKGLETIKSLFGEENIDGINLVSLFSYYDIIQDVGGFTGLLKVEFHQNIKDGFVPSKDSVCISLAEYKKLKSLLPDNELPSTAILANYLKDKAPAVPALNSEQIENYKIAFNDPVDNATKEKQALILTEFKELLKTSENSEKTVAEFFKLALNLEDEISQDNQNKLKDFFEVNKNEVALLFAKPGGLEKFVGIIGALGEGCVANIATFCKIAVNEALIEDVVAQILYPIFTDKIFTPLSHKSEGDILGGSAAGADIFGNFRVRESLISPEALFTEIQKQFYDDGKKIRDSWEFIKNFVGDDVTNGILENYSNENDYDFTNLEQFASQAAAYLVIKNSIPEILENQYSKSFKEKFEEVIKKAEIPAQDPSSPVVEKFVDEEGLGR
jgi:hypothetical protein